MEARKVPLTIYADEDLLDWIDRLPGRSRNEKILGILRESRNLIVHGTTDLRTSAQMNADLDMVLDLMKKHGWITSLPAREPRKLSSLLVTDESGQPRTIIGDLLRRAGSIDD